MTPFGDPPEIPVQAEVKANTKQRISSTGPSIPAQVDGVNAAQRVSEFCCSEDSRIGSDEFRGTTGRATHCDTQPVFGKGIELRPENRPHRPLPDAFYYGVFLAPDAALLIGRIPLDTRRPSRI